jgi:hypothetical protein
MVGILVHIGTTLDAQPQTVIPTQGLERQIQYHLVAEQRLEVDQVALKPAGEVIIWFGPGVDEQLLDIDLNLTRDFPEAPYALSANLDRRCAGDQHSLDDRLKPKIQLDR